MTVSAPGGPRSASEVRRRGTVRPTAAESDRARAAIGVIGLVAVTPAGRAAAGELAAAWPGQTRSYDGPATAQLPRAFAECGAVVAFLATGATVRLLAPHLGDKGSDPGVVCIDEARRFAVAILGGHAGGANALAERAAAVLGCEPVVTTASDAARTSALDTYGADLGFRIEEGSDLAEVGAAVLSGERVTVTSDATWPVPPLPANVVAAPAPEPRIPAIVITDRAPAHDPAHDPARHSVVYRPPSLVVGVGASSGLSHGEILDLVDAALAEGGLSPLSVRHLATVDLKAYEPGLVTAAERRGWPLVTYPPEVLARISVPSPSERVRDEVGTPSVAEAAALHVAGRLPATGEAAEEAAEADQTPTQTVRGSAAPAPQAELLVGKRKSANATVAVARHPPRGRLAVIGLGPGARDLLTPRGARELRRASVVVGLDRYVEQVRDLLAPGARVVATGLGDEQERARSAVTRARAGHAVALVGSGDAGVYAMAAPALEVADDSFDVDGVPGVTAAHAAASLLGAPLGHDHAVISLSDLHTGWDAIERRVRAAAEADLVVAFYNPRSRTRDWQLRRALRVLAEHRHPDTAVGIVRAATRTGERSVLTTLAAVDVAEVDMVSLVIVGATTTRVVAGRMVTPRGYRWSGELTNERSGRLSVREAARQAGAEASATGERGSATGNRGCAP